MLLFMKGLKTMEDKISSSTLYDSYTPLQLSEEIHNGLRTLLCDYNINGSLVKSSLLSKPEQRIFDNLSLMSEILLIKLRKENKNHR